MKHWMFMFRPDMYSIVKEARVLGVNLMHSERFLKLKSGDRFIAYLSKKSVLVARGVLTSDPYVDESELFGKDSFYPYRCHLSLEEHEARDGREILWGLSVFAKKEMKTTPANYLFLKGGFMEISEQDYSWLVEVLKGKVPAMLAAPDSASTT